jgi:hypothetical protein
MEYIYVHLPLGRTDGVHVACLVSRLEHYSHEAMITDLQLVAWLRPRRWSGQGCQVDARR